MQYFFHFVSQVGPQTSTKLWFSSDEQYFLPASVSNHITLKISPQLSSLPVEIEAVDSLMDVCAQ